MARRPEDRSPSAEDDHTVPSLAAGRIELEADVPAPGQTAKLAQQLVAVHRHCIAGERRGVKLGDPERSRSASVAEQAAAGNGALVLAGAGPRAALRVRRGMFRGSATLQALRGASFELHAGHTLAVVGESGCGKSTLARLVTLIEPPSAGRLTIDGIDVAEASGEQRRQLRQTVQIVFQDPYGSLNPRKKIGTILAEPLKVNTAHGARPSARARCATCWPGSGSGRSTMAATRTCSRAASASASRSRAR